MTRVLITPPRDLIRATVNLIGPPWKVTSYPRRLIGATRELIAATRDLICATVTLIGLQWKLTSQPRRLSEATRELIAPGSPGIDLRVKSGLTRESGEADAAQRPRRRSGDVEQQLGVHAKHEGRDDRRGDRQGQRRAERGLGP